MRVQYSEYSAELIKQCLTLFIIDTFLATLVFNASFYARLLLDYAGEDVHDDYLTLKVSLITLTNRAYSVNNML